MVFGKCVVFGNSMDPIKSDGLRLFTVNNFSVILGQLHRFDRELSGRVLDSRLKGRGLILTCVTSLHGR